MRTRQFLKKALRSATAAFVTVMAAASTAAAQQTVTATWDANTDAYTAGYRVFYGIASGSYQWNVDAGNQTSVPISLSPGVYYFVVRAYNSSSVLGPVSNEARIDLTQPAPSPTAQITATLSGPNTAMVSWSTTNAVSVTINGIAVGASGSTSVTVTQTTTYTIVATAADGRTATASATVTVTGQGAPGAPVNMASSVSGTRVTLSWQAPTSGGAPTGYLLHVGTSPGASDIANAYPVGNIVSVSGDLQRGRYYARVRAANGWGTSPDSNEVQFRVGRRLRTPGGFSITWEGTTATLSWTPDVGGPVEDTPTGYVLEAGTAPGLRDVATIMLGNVTSFRANVPSGRFYVRLRSFNALGESDPTADLVVAPPGAPSAPRGLWDAGAGQAVDLRWSPPSSGPAPTGYVLEAGSASGLSNLAVLPVGDVTRFVTTAPPGVYYVRVRAVNARGASEASNEIVVRR